MHVLVIDDEAAVRQILAATVARAGHSVDEARNCSEGAAKLVRGDVDVALCDIKMPDGNGVELMRSMRESGVDTMFIMVTAFASMETAIEALRAGASDYIIKPINNDELLHRLEHIASLRGLREENRELRRVVRENAAPVFHFASAAMCEVERLANRVAPTDSTVLITGESGTGKGVIAHAIHDQSRRADKTFLAVNCSAIPEQLMESEFFGHTKGAFTGADKARKGLFLQADRGTLFLDEIGELPFAMQTKLLHAIEEKEVRAVGSEQPRRVDVRIIAATNRNLEEMVRSGRFREDLYFRLGMFQIHIPPLRERQTDIRGLIQFILERTRVQRGGERTITVDPVAEDILLSHAWPGNVRQLENVLNRACILAEDEHLSVADLPPDITRTHHASAATGTFVAKEGELRERMRQTEANIIYRTLEEARGDRKVAAQKLGIGLSSLYRKIEEFEALGIVARTGVEAQPRALESNR